MKSNSPRVCVIGLGYIGLPTAAILASKGVSVHGVDINKKTVEIINQGKIHIIEPDLEGIVRETVSVGKLRVATQPSVADVFLIAVPTPLKENHEADLSYIQAAGKSISPFLKKGDLVILESTSPVGTTERLITWLAELRPDLNFPQSNDKNIDINIAYCPERVLPGQVIRELVNNERIIGGASTSCAESARNFYKIFVEGNCILTNSRTAELCKLAENTFRFVNIALANELALICDKFDINAWELVRLANLHPRVNILQPGIGVGGHCIAVDPWFLVGTSPEITPLIQAAGTVNMHKPEWVIDKIKKAVFHINKEDIKIACLGLAFKADIDDLRESPALYIVENLARISNINIGVNDPNIKYLPESLAKASIKKVSLEAALTQFDLIIVLVDHAQYKRINWSSISTPLIDFRGILSTTTIQPLPQDA